MTAPGGAICIDGDGDLDGDGIVNAKDFCEHMPGGAYDEDGDGIGDDCDACPIAKPPATPDPDGDGVDSPCDPDPRTPGDKIVLFNGFNAPLPANWTAGAAWQVRGGEAVMTPTNPDTVEQVVAPLPASSIHMAILAGYRIDSVAPGATEARAGVVGIDRRPAGTTILSCTGTRSGTTDTLLLETDAASNSKAATNLFDPAALYRIAEQIEGANTNCALISDKETSAVQAMSLGNTMSQVGVSARGATTRFTYLLVVAR
jgi:hypothetical protein